MIIYDKKILIRKKRRGKIILNKRDHVKYDLALGSWFSWNCPSKLNKAGGSWLKDWFWPCWKDLGPGGFGVTGVMDGYERETVDSTKGLGQREKERG